jgi:hypothetical protein
MHSGSLKDLPDLVNLSAVDRRDPLRRHAEFDPGGGCVLHVRLEYLPAAVTAAGISAGSCWLDGADTAASTRGMRLG